VQHLQVKAVAAETITEAVAVTAEIKEGEKSLLFYFSSI